MYDPKEQSIQSLIADARDDIKERVAAEIALRRAEVTTRLAASKTGVALIVVAALLVIAALTSMVVGLLLIASHFLGLVWATVITTVVVLGIAALLAKLGAGVISRALAGPADVI